MKLNELAPEFQAARPILADLEAAGFEAYFVGGAVRDALLHRPIHDVDIATSAYPAEVKQIFKRTIDTGIQHGTVTVMAHDVAYEVTTFRTESTYQDFRRPDNVTFVRSLKEDLKRRDFTINALAMRHDGEIIDLFDGLRDLRQGVLRAVGDPYARFHEDALRMMRAVRFQAQLAFQLEIRTKTAIAKNHRLLQKIAIERIHSEFIKLMLASNWQTGLATFIETKMSEAVPGFSGQATQLQKLTALAGHLTNECQVWGLFALTLTLNQKDTRQLLRAWKSANQVIDGTERLRQLATDLQTTDIDEAELKWALFSAGQIAVQDTLSVLKLMARITSEQQAEFRQIYDQLPLQSSKALAVNGQDLMTNGIQPGPELGRTLQRLRYAVVVGQLPNNKAALLSTIKK
ncbi:CCA tRNA nucleotidyltransferase [Lactobacillus sp. CC-MHH1034]|uniref:CCA tRNA nucleotidyltransferase n=1 Tax=Agrilactobacillus fermenti TaxID=2586909 RepID=UPI001E319325|nr:CCA tRNA nucleotidyltransferase [Agrilactobacillus fermenti]MCD2255207.1 CCA tRNA nucleotidyltransferase [Agrilactobacillus fermenti]